AAAWPGRIEGGGGGPGGGEGPPGDEVDIEEPIAVVVEQPHAAAHGLGELVDRRPAVVLDEAGQVRGRGPIGELRAGTASGTTPRRRDAMAGRDRSELGRKELAEAAGRRRGRRTGPARAEGGPTHPAVRLRARRDQLPEGAGLERPAESFRQGGQLGEMLGIAVLLVEPVVTVHRGVQLGLAAAVRGGGRRVAGLLKELGQASECGGST